MDEDERRIGFTPQKETPFNKFLPYSEKINDEADQQLANLKAYLPKSVQLRDLKMSSVYWANQLPRYIKLYGMRFSKEDHVLFINLFYDIVTIPDLNLSLVARFAQVLLILLRKRKRLSREDLVIQWRPLYVLFESVFFSKYEHYGLQQYPANIEEIIKSLVRLSRAYFPSDSTQEMLDEWYPLLCPYDMSMLKAMLYFELFLPTLMPPEEHHKGFKLWFDKFINLWESFHNMPQWESHLVILFARLANQNIGYIDWNPYIGKIYTRFLRGFDLPVGKVQLKHTGQPFEITIYGLWMIAMMGADSSSGEHLRKLFKAVETFCHPSNIGHWTAKLYLFISALPAMLVKRLHRERYMNPTWEPQIPDSHKLTDEHISEFVDSMSAVVSLCMFGKTESVAAARALQSLAQLKPEIIIPPILEKLYPAMETLTEPHRFTSCLTCLSCVARHLLEGKQYPEGQTHLLSILNLCLPGIDSNDFRKSMVTFQMISSFTSMVPIVDCSEAYQHRNDLTDIEREVCSSTALFEDFVLLLFDRIFALIENSSREHTSRMDSVTHERMNHQETLLEMAMAATVATIFQQCSQPIYQVAIQKLYNFVTSNVFEVRVAGRYMADMVRASAKANAEKALKLFLPVFFQNILSLTENEENQTEEHVDDQLLWYLLLTSEIVRCNGQALLPYKEDLIKVLKSTLHLTCIQGSKLACNLLKHLLKSLTRIHMLDYKSVVSDFNKPLSEYLAIRDWAAPGDIDNLNINWHIPCPEEKQFATELLEIFLVEELSRIQKHIEGDTLKREELLQRLKIILSCIDGAGYKLPCLPGDNIVLSEGLVPLPSFKHTCDTDTEGININGQNVRQLVTSSMQKLLEHMLQKSEDDTKSLFEIINILSAVMFFMGTPKDEFDKSWKGFHLVKKSMENQLIGKKSHFRTLLVDRVQLQHESQVINQQLVFTEHHKRILGDLLRLSVSNYREVRQKSQAVLFQGFNSFLYSYKLFLPDILQYLKKDSNIPDHQFKGSLYVLISTGKGSLALKRDWSVMEQVWTALCQTQHSEKPSILKLIDKLVNQIHSQYRTVEISIKVSDACLDTASKFWSQSSNPRPSTTMTTESELQMGKDKEDERNERNLKFYHILVNKLVHLVEQGNLHWKFSQMAMDFTSLLIRCDILLPVNAVKMFVAALVHDTLAVRKLAITAVSSILKQQRRPFKKITVDPYSISKTSRSSDVRVGNRPDNQFVLYNSDSLVDTKEKWQASVFVEKTHWGFHTWPREFKVYAPAEDQPKLDRKLEDFTDCEKPFYEHFTNPEFVDKLIRFLSLEEDKRNDRFQTRNFVLFKTLFKNYGDAFLSVIKTHIERLVQDTSHETHDCSHRCAAEIIAGLLRGTKLWSFEKCSQLWDWLIPVLKTVLSNLTVETVHDWAECFSSMVENRDPRKFHWLYEVLMTAPLSGEGGSFSDSSRLMILQGALAQQEWRVPDLLHRLLEYLRSHLKHSYKNVRDRLGSSLTSIFLFDLSIPFGVLDQCPKRADFIAEILPQLETLKELRESDVNGENATENGVDAVEKRKTDIKLCKTVLKWLQGNFTRMYDVGPAEIFKFLPIIAPLSSDLNDVDLKRDVLVTLTIMSQAYLEPSIIPTVLHNIKEVMGLASWHSRTAILTYIQMMVFSNFFSFQKHELKETVKEMVLHLLCDDQLEVRELAAQTLSGFIHCGFLDMNDQLWQHFKQLSSTKLKKRRTLTEVTNPESLLKRHAGVLGLSAFVQAYPYDVPEFMPQVLMGLSDHIDDPQPIQMTVKKTLSNFRRTHYDNWQDHKQKFTDDQLVILTDLLVSPNYYA